MTAISAVGTFLAMIGTAVVTWLEQFRIAGVPVLACSIFLACFGIFERLFLARLLNYNPASSVEKEVKREGKPAGSPPRTRRLASGEKALPEKGTTPVYNVTYEVKK